MLQYSNTEYDWFVVSYSLFLHLDFPSRQIIVFIVELLLVLEQRLLDQFHQLSFILDHHSPDMARYIFTTLTISLIDH